MSAAPDQWATGSATVGSILHSVASVQGHEDLWGSVLVPWRDSVIARPAYLSRVYGRLYYSPHQGDAFRAAPDGVVQTWRPGTAAAYRDAFKGRHVADPHQGLANR